MQAAPEAEQRFKQLTQGTLPMGKGAAERPEVFQERIVFTKPKEDGRRFNDVQKAAATPGGVRIGAFADEPAPEADVAE
jgi:hypothetical protein